MNYKTINVKIIILIVFFLHVAGVNAEEVKNDVVYDFTPSKDEATLYIYREQIFSGGLVDYDIYLNDVFLRSLEDDSYIKVKIKPGIHDLWSYMSETRNKIALSHMELIMKKGGNYFIYLDISLARDQLFIADEAIAKQIITEIQFAVDEPETNEEEF